MTVTHESLARLDTHWAIAAFGTKRCAQTLAVVHTLYAKLALGHQISFEKYEQDNDSEAFDRLATAYEIAAIEGNECPCRHLKTGLRSPTEFILTRVWDISRLINVLKNMDFLLFPGLDTLLH